MKQSILGYKDSSPDNRENSLYIDGNLITMKGVSRPLTLIPIMNGKPQYGKRRIAHPGDDDIDFGEGVTGVIEMPYAQTGSYVGGMQYAPQNLMASLNYAQGLSGNSYMENANTNLSNPYARQIPTQQINQPYSLGTPPVPNFNAPSSYSENLSPINTSLNGVIMPNMQTELDSNLRQQQEALNITTQQKERKRRTPFVGAINPYGSFDLNSSATMLGASIEDGNTLGIISSAGKILTSGLRNGLSGAAAVRRYNESYNDYLEADAEQRRKEGEYYTYQTGGSVTEKRPGLLLTGNFLEGNDEHPNPNSELEAKEYIQTPDGNTMKIVGDRHSEGGELLNLPEGTKVVSDYLKIGGKLATYFKKNYGINVVAGSTFASVLEKYKKKIGLTKILEEEASIMDKIVDQDDVEMDATRDINLQVLSKRVNDIQPEKKPLEEDFSMFTNLVFQKQEEQKKTEENKFEKQEGGAVDQDQAMLAQAISQYAEMNGQSPEDLINQLQALPEDQQQQAITQIMSAVNGGQDQMQDQSQQGGIEELITQYAQLVGQDTAAIVQQLQQMSEDEAMQTIQQMTQAVEGTEQQPELESEVVPDTNSAPSEEMQTMQQGGITRAVRNAELPRSYDTLPFTVTNAEGVLDYDLQRLNPATGTYDNFDPNVRIANYLNYIPVKADEYFERKADNTYGLKDGVTYGQFQRGYNKTMGNNYQFFKDQAESLPADKRKEYLTNLDNYNKDIIFTTDKESEYKGKTARGIDGKFGQFTSTRSGYQRPIVTPDQKAQLNNMGVYTLNQLLKNDKAQEIIGKDLADKLKSEDKKYGGLDYSLEAVPSTQPEAPAEKTSSTSDISRPNIGTRNSPSLPIATPDQSNLPPNYLATSMRQTGTNLADKVFLSPEENLKELSRQANTAANQIVSNNPYTAGAALSSLQVNQNNAINQAMMQTMLANQQDERNVNNINEERIMQRDRTNLGLADKYEREAITGNDAFYAEWRNFIDNRNRQNLSNYNLQQQVNAFNAINPNYQIGPNGEIYQTDEPLTIQLGNGQTIKVDPRTKKQIIEKTTSADGKTQTTTKTTQKKKGGFITTDLSKMLKSKK